MTSTDAQRRPVYVDRRNNRLFADPLIGNGAWPEVQITPSMMEEVPGNVILGSAGFGPQQPSPLSADSAIGVLNTAGTTQLNGSRVQAATTSSAGAVQLTDSVASTSTTTAATPNSIKQAYDIASAALPKSGGTMTGSITFAGSQATATTSSPGIVQLTDSTTSTSTTTAATPQSVKTAFDLANAAMPKAGGTFGGVVTFNSEVLITSLNGGCLAGLRNRIINGCMRICQRSASTSVPAGTASRYTLDRWCAVNLTDGSFSVGQSLDVPADQGFSNSLLVVTNTADAVLTTSQRASIQQRIEGYQVVDFAFGSTAAKTVWVSFWVKSSLTGVFGFSVRNASSSATRSYNFRYEVFTANTWEKKTIAVPGDQLGTWNTGNDVGMNLTWSLGCGTGARGVEFWTAGDTDSDPNITALPIQSTGATWFITGVQVETSISGAGNITPFERRPLALELLLCQRYYWNSYKHGVAPGTVTPDGQHVSVSSSSGVWRATVPFKATMRNTPATVTSYSPTTGSAGAYRDDSASGDRTIGLFSAGTDNASFTGNTGSNALIRFHVAAEAEL
jgi:hypothetical protein